MLCSARSQCSPSRGSSQRIRFRLFALLAALLAPSAAPALELFDGRFVLHGAYGTDMRAMARDLDVSDGLDLTQWFHILNLEAEFDFAPDGFGPFDLVQGFLRVEVRYDCVWVRSCGIFSGADAFGDRAKRVPGRLGDGRRAGYRTTGSLFNGDQRRFADIGRAELPFQFSRSDPFDANSPLSPNGSLRPSPFFTIQGIDTLYDNRGVDNVFGTADDPAPFYFERQERRCVFTYRKTAGSMNGVGTQVLGPWNPGCPIEPLGALAGKPDPLSDQDFNPILGAGAVGSEALPYRPRARNRATDASGAPLPLANPAESQGVYFPNAELARLIRDGDFDSFDQKFRQEELAWNRGASQQDEKELKEAYLDLELFDSRLWLRVGKQQIVWGKTELFRNQDQWNPQDLALASLPSLEESRIAQWSVRGVWAFYDIGPLQDVRLELAGVFDQFEPTDIGRCGEPYTPNPACNKTLGLFIHGLTGFGVAGEVRPPNPWNSSRGLEVGARLEWRWERFSFALTEYRGFTDIPYQDNIFRYSRNVDPRTGRPRRAMSSRGCDPDGLVDGDTAGCLGPGADALANHSVNQQIFRMICATSIGFTTLDTTACGQSVFTSPNPALGVIDINTGLSRIVSGQPGGLGGQTLYTILVGALGGGTGFAPGVIAAETVTGSSSPLVPLVLNPSDGGGDPSGLSAYLTREQEALLGCGDFYGTDCDAGGVALLDGELGGIDLMNAEASALLQSMPGFEGSFGVFPGGGWNLLDDSVDQPGTRRFQGGTACARFFDGQLQVLPGCRPDDGSDSDYDENIDGSTGAGGTRHPFAGLGPDGLFGTADDQFFRSEMAMVSWNFLMGLVGLSGVGLTPATPTVTDFDPTNPFRDDGCSFVRVEFCRTVQAFFQITGVQRNDVRAGGNGRFGRRDFNWHGGRDVVLRYDKRNVLGFSMDFAEDITKSSWGIEATWQEGLSFNDNDALDGVARDIDTYNVTISVDRPTFVNFLNPNRTLFINTQWFIQYVDGYRKSFQSNGPWNVLGVLSVQSGYFDDRLLPRMTLVYDVKSNSGAFVPEVTYRFTSDFNASVGLAIFSGREQSRRMAISPINLANRTGRHAYKDFVENGLSAIRDRDEVFLKIRYSF